MSRREKKPKVPISANPKIQFTKKEKLQGTKGRCKEHHYAGQGNRSRYEWDEGNYKDEEKEMGALCFTQRVRRTQVPKGFKLPHDQQKYDGSQEHELWVSDYLQAVKILRGSRATTMQSLQLHLTGAAWS
jgi:hypothetical protein